MEHQQTGVAGPYSWAPHIWRLGREAAQATPSLDKALLPRKGLGRLQQQLLERSTEDLISM